ncbi:MAG: acyl-ACP--UDP-N-acetylglucosamine O-acyltransferase [Planctomycetota bacterium]
MKIHKLADVHPKAKIDDDVIIGPFTLIGEHVSIGKGSVIHNGVTILGNTTFGKNNTVFPGTVIGSQPQDKKYQGEPTSVQIGDGNVIRECVTINVGTEQGRTVTRMGDNNLLMACSHIAHDCILGNSVTIANGVLLGGHVEVEDDVTFGGLAAVHHFVTIGKIAFVGGLTRVVKDVPPFMTVEGNPSKIWFPNRVGLERNGVSAEGIEALKQAHKILFRKGGTRPEAIAEIEELGLKTPEVEYIIEFVLKTDKGRVGRMQETP